MHSAEKADWDNDGDIDLALLTYLDDNITFSDEVSILLNNGTGIFTISNYSMNAPLRELGSGDFDGDTDIDLIASVGAGANVTILFMPNDGTGVFDSSKTLSSPLGLATWIGTIGISTGALNDDNILDILVPYNTGRNTPVQIAVMFGNGTGTFARGQVYFNVSSPSTGSVTPVDFDADGDTDVVMVNSSGGLPVDPNTRIWIMKNKGGMLFEQVSYLITSYLPNFLVINDVNNDGFPDIITSDLLFKSVSVYLNQGDGSIDPNLAQHYQVISYPRPIGIGDFDGDGDKDIVVQGFGNNPPLNTSVLINQTPRLLSSFLLKIHNTHSFALGIPLDGKQVIEPRQGGLNEIALEFDNDPSHVEISLSKGTFTSSIVGNTMNLTTSGISEGNCVSLTLNGINNENKTLNLVPLLGDATGDGVVNFSDLNMTKLNLFKPVTSANFRADVNADGVINIVDLSTVKSNLFKTAQACS